MSEILTFGLMVGQPALRNLCLAGSPRTLLAMSAPRKADNPKRALKPEASLNNTAERPIKPGGSISPSRRRGLSLSH